MYPTCNEMVKPIWRENIVIKKLYKGSTVSRFKYQSLIKK